MATRIPRKVLSSLKGRVLSSQAAAAPAEAGGRLPKQTPKVTSLPNGVIVASLENYSPLSSVSVVVNAGARFESGENKGLTHCLRVASGLTTENSSQFKIARVVQQTGGNLSVTSTREYLYYTVDCLRNDIASVIPFLRDVTTCPSFKPWEVADIQAQLKDDIAVLETQPHVKVFELLHAAAFRNTLGRSLYAPSYQVGNFNSEQLQHYVQTHFIGGRIGVVGTGVDHDFLVAEAKSLKPYSSAGPEAIAAQYHGGGELREHTGSPLTYAAVAVEGPSLASKDLLHAGVLQNIMGSGPYVKYSPNTFGSKLGQAVSQVSTKPFAVSAISSNYTDSGLFGFAAVAQPEEIGAVLKAAFSQFAAITKGSITDQDVARGKNQLKSWVLMNMEHSGCVLMDLGEQAMGHQQVLPLHEVISMIDKVSTADVVSLAKKMVNGKPSMAAVGDLSKTPYLDELYK